ncbi:MAG: amidohydrolase, partial [Candidatus Aminicenantes bacterium]|nr:amidohydrolase [Candidatus Aminicenantes bacterium]
MATTPRSPALAPVALCAILVSVSLPKAQPARPDVVAFVHAAVVPMDRDRVVQDQTVVVANGQIVAIGPSATAAVPANALRIDARGRYLLPALSDMHVHLLGESWNAMFPP